MNLMKLNKVVSTYETSLSNLTPLSPEWTKLKQELLERVAEVKSQYPLQLGELLPWQKMFHRSKRKLRIVAGGNRIGKTEAGAREALWYSLGQHPYRSIATPNKGWILSVNYNQQREAAQAKITKLCPKSEIKRVVNIQRGIIDYIELNNGSLIYFKSAEVGREAMQGADIDWLWCDEEPPEDIYKECIIRVGGGRKLIIWITMTPLKGFTWMWHQIWKKAEHDPNMERFFASIYDNKFITKDELRRVEEAFPDEYERAARLKGDWVAMGTRPVFNREIMSRMMNDAPEPIKVGDLVATAD